MRMTSKTMTEDFLALGTVLQLRATQSILPGSWSDSTMGTLALFLNFPESKIILK